MTEQQVRELVRQRAARFAINRGSTGLTEWCRRKGIAKSHASEFMRGLRAPTNDLLSALGLEYRIVRKRRRRCPLCTDRRTWTGDPAVSFCEKHLRLYRSTTNA
jgi:hypothetical protein